MPTYTQHFEYIFFLAKIQTMQLNPGWLHYTHILKNRKMMCLKYRYVYKKAGFVCSNS